MIKKMSMLGMLFIVFLLNGQKAEASTIFDNKYVTFSSTGEAWSTCEGITDTRFYGLNEEVYSGIERRRDIQPGEHYYWYEREGNIPVEKWVVNWVYGMCKTKTILTGGVWKGVRYVASNCWNYYYSGWFPYCADCGGQIGNLLFYMSKECCESLKYIYCNSFYYYLCPHCQSMEMGAIVKHTCSAISKNKYAIRYLKNSRYASGSMEDSFHIYDNETEYEGEPFEGQTQLSKNEFTREGYIFLGWTDNPGSNIVKYQDEAEVKNLTADNYNEATGEGIVNLYAVWKSEMDLGVVAQIKNDRDGSSVFFPGDTGVIRVKITGYATELEYVQKNQGMYDIGEKTKITLPAWKTYEFDIPFTAPDKIGTKILRFYQFTAYREEEKISSTVKFTLLSAPRGDPSKIKVRLK